MPVQTSQSVNELRAATERRSPSSKATRRRSRRGMRTARASASGALEKAHHPIRLRTKESLANLYLAVLVHDTNADRLLVEADADKVYGLLLVWKLTQSKKRFKRLPRTQGTANRLDLLLHRWANDVPVHRAVTRCGTNGCYSIQPPPRTSSSSKKTAAWPGVIALCGASKATRAR